jgi:hypothetical protein
MSLQQTARTRTLNTYTEEYMDLRGATNVEVKEENGDFLANFQNILNRWKNFISQLLNVHRVSDVRQREVHKLRC